MIFLALLEKYWPVLAVVAFLAGVFFYGQHVGASAARAECERVMQEAANQANEKRNQIQQDADKKARQYETARATIKQLSEDLTRRLNDAQAQNPAFASCHAGADFVQLYDAARAGSGR